MKQSLPGLLERAARMLRDAQADDFAASWYAGGLEQLLTHLREVRDRYRAGDVTVVDEFFALYVFDGDPTPSAPVAPTGPESPPVSEADRTEVRLWKSFAQLFAFGKVRMEADPNDNRLEAELDEQLARRFARVRAEGARSQS